MRTYTTDGFKLNFIAAQSYVKSLKKRSILRIELMSAVILTRLIATIRKELPCCQIYLWTDWLKMSTTRFKPFVSDRVQVIRDMLYDDISCFRYIRSSLSPGEAFTKLVADSKLDGWYERPGFLKNSDTISTITPDAPNNIDEIS